MKIKINTKTMKSVALVGVGLVAFNGLQGAITKSTSTNELELLLANTSRGIVQQTSVVGGVNTITTIEGVKTSPQAYKDSNKITKDILNKYKITIDENKYGDHSILEEGTKIAIEKELETEYGRGDLIIFNPQDVTEISNLTVSQIQSLIPSTMDEEGMAQKLYDIEHSEKPINAPFIISKAINESDAGKSNVAKYKNNLFGLRCDNQYKDGFEQYIKTKDEKYKDSYDKFGNTYQTKSESIDDLINGFLYEKYLNGGVYDNGKSIFGVNTKYCTSVTKSAKLITEIENMEKQLQIRNEDNTLNIEYKKIMK